jgi:hypothetical protein
VARIYVVLRKLPQVSCVNKEMYLTSKLLYSLYVLFLEHSFASGCKGDPEEEWHCSMLCRWPLRDYEHVLHVVCCRLASAIGLAHHHVVVHEALASPWTPVNSSEVMPLSKDTFSSLYSGLRGPSYTGILNQTGALGNTHYEPRV